MTSLTCVTCDQQLVAHEWIEFVSGYNTADTVVSDRRQKQVMKKTV